MLETWLTHGGTYDPSRLLVTDWPVTDAESAVPIFRPYRQRWAVEDIYRFVRDTLG
jgi:hypothetical protein